MLHPSSIPDSAESERQRARIRSHNQSVAADEHYLVAQRRANSAAVDLVSVSPAHAVHGTSMGGKINAKLHSKAPDLDLPLLLRQLGTEV